MLNLLALYIEAKTGLFVHSSDKDISLISKGMSQNCLDNIIIEEVNFNAKKLKKVYKNQKIPKENEIFKDELFPPNLHSIFGIIKGKPIDLNDSILKKLNEDFMLEPDNIIWLRASEIFQGVKYSIFVDDVSIDDVVQGNLGNCYFMSSLAAMTTMPQLIYQIFRTIEVPKNCCYEIVMNIEGDWKIVLLDDYFPCSKKTRKPVFAKPNGPELWAMLLEKAWAKINGGYLNIIGGNASEVLCTLTSFPIETIKLKPEIEDDIWDQLNNSFNRGQIISCFSNIDKDIEKFGLISGHSFTVTNFTDGFVDGDLVRLIRLRNPWGYREWNGPWSDNSPLWTEEAKKELNANVIVSDDGEFWMSFEDFFNYFCAVDISKVINPQCVRTFQIQKKELENANVFELQIFSRTEIIICAYKKNYRFHRTMKSDEELAINLLICKKGNNNSLQLIATTNENISNPMLNLELTVGFYLVYVYCNYKYSTYEKQRKIRIYASSNKFFSLFPKEKDTNLNLLKQIILQFYQKEFQYNNQMKKDVRMITGNKFHSTTFGYLLLHNNSSDHIRFSLINISQNFDLFYPFYENSKEVEITIPPTKTAVFAGVRKLYNEEYKFSLSIIRHTSLIVPKITESTPLHKNKLPPDKNQLLRANKINDLKMQTVPYYSTIDQIKSMLTNVNGDNEKEQEYDFIFKKIAINTERLAEKIDYKKNVENYFLEKYKKEMKMILSEVEELDDGENVMFRDVFDYGDKYYIGEWKIKEDLNKHGRGLLVYGDGSSYLGQFANDKREGKGKFFYNNGEVIEIEWKDNEMDGVGILTKINGDKIKVLYQKGKKIV